MDRCVIGYFVPWNVSVCERGGGSMHGCFSGLLALTRSIDAIARLLSPSFFRRAHPVTSPGYYASLAPRTRISFAATDTAHSCCEELRLSSPP